jgi:DNA-binding beta-propeller fold protein YncE
MQESRVCWLALALYWLIGAGAAWAQGEPFVNFETIPTRALALAPDGSRLFVTNTPDGRLEIFAVGADGSLTPAGAVSVGLDPIALAVRSAREVWVVNHLSDSVSVVDVGAVPPRVVRTLWVGDEPRDIVFAGPERRRAFISAARRGQNHPDDTLAELQTPGLGRADVWVFDAESPGTSAGGDPIAIVTLFGDKPGALTASDDGSTVFASIFTSGNQTSTISVDATRCIPPQLPPGSPPPATCALFSGAIVPARTPGPQASQAGDVKPETGVIVKFDPSSGAWLDAQGGDWRQVVPFELPDNDVFRIDAMATPPVQTGVFQHVGTLNKSLAVHPRSGKLYVATIDAINTNRFLSVPRLGMFPNLDARFAARTADPVTGRTLNGHLYESRIAILEPGRPVVSRHLNKHIDYELVPSPPGVKERSVADPQGLAFSPDGETLFVAALGSRRIVPFRTGQLDDGSFQPDASSHIPLSGRGGPTDMVIDPSGRHMYVYKRFDNAVATVDLQARRETSVSELFNPEPDTVRLGRAFFYDALLTSSNGEANCNVCHPAGDKDDLAWDLGSPFGTRTPNPNFTALGQPPPFSPLKGPMTVLTLRGIKDSGPMFWRGEATNARNPLDERVNFQNFNVVFEALLGREGPLAQPDFDLFTDWALSLVPPPNPHRPLDNVLTPAQQSGSFIFFGNEGSTDFLICSSCHRTDPVRGSFGTGGEVSFENEPQFFKVTQLRTVYDKVGMFGATRGTLGDARTRGGPRIDLGPQIRGTGTLHDGSFAGVDEFLTFPIFSLDTRKLQAVTDFVYAFPSNLAPITGQQVTLHAESGPDARERVDLLMQRAAAPMQIPPRPGDPIESFTECDLVAKTVVDGSPRGFVFEPGASGFRDDLGMLLPVDAVLSLGNRPGEPITFTCLYPRGGRRAGIDRDLDGVLDGNESVDGLEGLARLLSVLQQLTQLLELLKQLFGGF